MDFKDINEIIFKFQQKRIELLFPFRFDARNSSAATNSSFLAKFLRKSKFKQSPHIGTIEINKSCPLRWPDRDSMLKMPTSYHNLKHRNWYASTKI